MEKTVLATIVFSPESHTDFARLSGDWNPLHMNPLAARRTQVGFTVVHGMHIVACCMESVASHFPQLSLPARLKVRFVKPVYVGEPVVIYFAGRNSIGFQQLLFGMFGDANYARNGFQDGGQGSFDVTLPALFKLLWKHEETEIMNGDDAGARASERYHK